MEKKRKIGVLGSGSGSNMQALLDAIEVGELAAEIVLVMSDNPDGYILERARQAGIPAEVIDCAGYQSKFPDHCQERVGKRLQEAGAEFVCLAGFMRLVKQPLLDVYGGKILNIHPSLLPHFPGLEAWRQAIDAGVAESGCTVHYVDAGMDTGPVIVQRQVPVLQGDTAETLHERIQEQEHIAYPEALKLVFAQSP